MRRGGGRRGCWGQEARGKGGEGRRTNTFFCHLVMCITAKCCGHLCYI